MSDAGAIADEVEAFLTGERHGPSADRVLSTVLFTDIVGPPGGWSNSATPAGPISSPNMTI
jgi:hypothetical protein